MVFRTDSSAEDSMRANGRQIAAQPLEDGISRFSRRQTADNGMGGARCGMHEELVSRLNGRIKAVDGKLGMHDFLSYLRASWLEKAVDGVMRRRIEASGVEIPSLGGIPQNVRAAFDGIAKDENLSWGDARTHLLLRITDAEGLEACVPELSADARSDARAALDEGFKMSIMPLNLVLGGSLLGKFIPGLDMIDPDPYGIFTDGARRVHEGVYIGSKKFDDALLVNMVDDGRIVFCAGGCINCYKGFFVRHEREFDVERVPVEVQVEKLMEWLLEDAEGRKIDNFIFSGGEPLTLSKERWKKILSIVEEGIAKMQKDRPMTVRLCTGTVFQGMFFAMDDEFIEMLDGFQKRTGRAVIVNAHLSTISQITPEAIMLIEKLARKGISVHSQIPIQEGINYWHDDMAKTLAYWREFGRRQKAARIHPYKYILDMHKNNMGIPLEQFLRMQAVLMGHRESDLKLPNAMEILCRDGNMLLNPQKILAMGKEVDEGAGVVRYKIVQSYTEESVVESNGKSGEPVVWKYEEPLVAGINDDPDSLEKEREAIASALKRNA